MSDILKNCKSAEILKKLIIIEEKQYNLLKSLEQSCRDCKINNLAKCPEGGAQAVKNAIYIILCKDIQQQIRK